MIFVIWKTRVLNLIMWDDLDQMYLFFIIIEYNFTLDVQKLIFNFFTL